MPLTLHAGEHARVCVFVFFLCVLLVSVVLSKCVVL
uniref:Uncharacterized protein n=1 Tax=Anopheles christyi TaxID=43041 RepID=A0A182KI40_9DIPT